MLEEPQLNGRIASVINKLTNSAGWQAREELRGALRGPDTKPDVLITRADGPPIVLETEYLPASTVAADCMKSIGRELDPTVANAAGKVSSVIAIRATEELHQCATGRDAERMLEDGHEIEYAVYQGTDKEQTRFPQSGFIKGNMRDLVDFIRPASEPQDTINVAIQIFESGVEDAAALILACARNTNIGEAIGTTLRQQWPAYPAQAPTKPDKQEKEDQNARSQTAKMTATMLINALAYQQNLAGFSAEVEINGQKETRTIKSLAQVRQPTGLHPDDVLAEWDNILTINYWPIFHIAKQLLTIIPPDSHGIIKPGYEDAAEELWQQASHLHISNECRFNSSPTCAVFTHQHSMGGRSWPSFCMRTTEAEKVTCTWLNGTLGLIGYWIESNRSQSGRGGTSVSAIPHIPSLDVTKLKPLQLQAAVQIYDDFCQKPMLPANEAYHDSVRQELDRRLLTEVLGLDDSAVEQLAILRHQWCREPTVTGTKTTGPDS